MNDASTAMATVPQGGPQTGAMIPAPSGQMGLMPQVVPLDRDSLAFYGDLIVSANLVPEEKGVDPRVSKFRVMARIIAGASYGFDPLLSQQCFDSLFNRMVPNAHGMEILFADNGEFDTRIKELTDDVCTVVVLRQFDGEWNEARGRFEGGEWRAVGEVTYTFAMAQKAGIDKSNTNWNKYRQDMLYSKVMKRVTKRFNARCLKPRLMLGNYFAKAHQAPQQIAPTPNEPNTPAPQIGPATDAQAETSEQTGSTSLGETAWKDQPYAEGDSPTFAPAIDDDDSSEAAVVEYEQPQDPPAEVETVGENAEPIDGEPVGEIEPKGLDRNSLLLQLRDLFKVKFNNQKKRIDEFTRGQDPATLDTNILAGMVQELARQ